MKWMASILFGVLFSSSSAQQIPIENLFVDPEFSHADISPDGTFVSGLERGEVPKLVLKRTNNQKQQSIVRFEKTKLRGYEWIDNDHILLRDGNSNSSRYTLIKITQREPEIKVTTKKVGDYGYLLNPLRSAPGHLLFVATDDDDDLGIYRITTDQLVEGNFDEYETFVPQSDGALVYWSGSNALFSGSVENEKFAIKIWQPSEGKWNDVYRLSFGEMEFEPVGKKNDEIIYVLTNATTDKVSLVEFDITDQSFGKILYTHNRYDLTSAEVNESTNQVESVGYIEHGELRKHYLNEKESDSFLKTELKNVSQVVEISQDVTEKKELLFAFASDNPGSYYLYDKSIPKVRAIASAHPELESTHFEKTQSFSVKAKDGINIEALFTPANRYHDSGVLLVMPHGGPIGVRDYAFFQRDVQFLSNRGYSVLQVNFRGSSGFGKKFQQSGVGQLGKIIESDISQVVSHLLETRSFKSLCAIGASYGAYSSLTLALKEPDKYQCVIARYGVYDLMLLFNANNLMAHSEQHRQSVTKTIGNDLEKLLEQSPLYHLSTLKAPTLVIGGMKDQITPIEHTKRLLFFLKNMGKDVEELVYGEVGHGYHENWLGDRHEWSLIDDFIARKLALDLGKIGRSDEVLGQQYELIARGFNYTKGIKFDSSRALEYFQKAADLGNVFAMSTLAEYLLAGERIERNYSKALDYLRLSAEGGDPASNYTLGLLNLNPEFDEYDPGLGIKRLKGAAKHGYSKAAVELAAAECLYPQHRTEGFECSKSRLFDEEVKGISFNKLQKRIVELYLEEKLDADTKQFLKVYLLDSKDNVSDVNLRVSKLAVGKALGKGKEVVETGELYFQDKPKFGVKIQVNPMDDATLTKGLLLYRWTFHSVNGRDLDKTIAGTVAMAPSEVDRFTMSVKSRLSGEGIWKLEIFNVDRTLLLEESFAIKSKTIVPDVT